MIQMIWEWVVDASRSGGVAYARRPTLGNRDALVPDGQRLLSIEQMIERTGRTREDLTADYRATFAEDFKKEDGGLVAEDDPRAPRFELDPKSPEGIRNRVLDLFDPELDLLHAWKYPHLNDDNWPLYLALCHQHGLNPWSNQVFADFLHDEKTNLPKLVLIVGIAGIRLLAERTGERGGASGAKFKFDAAGNPTHAKIAVYRRTKTGDRVRYIGEAKASEYTHLGLKKYAAEMPEHRLKKLAESQGYKQAYPEMGDIFTPEEVQEKLISRKSPPEEGRQIEAVQDRRATDRWDAVDAPYQDDGVDFPAHGQVKRDPLRAAFERRQRSR